MLQKIKLLYLRILHRLFKKSCFYINGPETLPPPLTKEEEETVMKELLRRISGAPPRADQVAALVTPQLVPGD